MTCRSRATLGLLLLIAALTAAAGCLDPTPVLPTTGTTGGCSGATGGGGAGGGDAGCPSP